MPMEEHEQPTAMEVNPQPSATDAQDPSPALVLAIEQPEAQE
jgi:hypothetical protein